MKTRWIGAALLALSLAVSAQATTETHPLSLELVPMGGERMALRLENTGDEPATVQLALRASSGAVHSDELVDELELAAGELFVAALRWSDAGEGDFLRARAWLAGSSSFVQARRFVKAGALVELAAVLDEGVLPRFEPRFLFSESRSVRGRVVFPAYAGGLQPLGRARVKIGGVQGETDDEGGFELSGVPAGEAVLEVSMENAHWKIRSRSSSKAYTFTSESFTVSEDGAVDLGEIQLPADQPVTEAAWIQDVCAKGARFLLEQGDDLSWWDDLPIYWPSGGDYYSWGSLNITEAHRWDVVGHELGHAVYFQSSKFSGGGGSHKIDECYSTGLALSEGWATYFSAAIQLERDDPDAKFEFLVPRRAPIRIENVPDDVCPGHKNEWRVAAMFWDLFDTHADGEDAAGFSWGASSWDLMRSQWRGKSGRHVLNKLKEAMSDEDKALAEKVAAQNTID